MSITLEKSYRTIGAVQEQRPIAAQQENRREAFASPTQRIINAAMSHIAEMQHVAIDRGTAIDRVLREKPHGHVEDMLLGHQRKIAGVPVHIDPEALFRDIHTDLSIESQQHPTVHAVVEKKKTQVHHGINPLRASYDAAKALILAEWHLLEGRAAEAEEQKRRWTDRMYGKPDGDRVRAIATHLDLPKRFGEDVFVGLHNPHND